MHSGGITTDGHANAYEYFIQIWRKVHKLCTFPNSISKVEMQPLHNGQDLRDDMIGLTRPSGSLFRPALLRLPQSNAHTSKGESSHKEDVRLPTTVVPSIVCGKEEERPCGGIRPSDGDRGGAARKIKQPTGASLALTCLFRGESAKEQDDEPYIVSRALLTMAKLEG